MSQLTTPPFRADQVGSLLKSKELQEAHKKLDAGELSAAEFRELADRCVLDVIKLQEETGIQAITDGELGRNFWHVDFLTGFEGIVWTHSDYAVSFKGDHGERAKTSSMLVVNGKVCRSHPSRSTISRS